MAERVPPTLLTVPQELRNAIFTHVYEPASSDNFIGLHLVTMRRAGVKSHQAPPTKDTLLVCKQLHKEMREMQAAVFRRYWTTQKFHLYWPRSHDERLHLTVVADRDVQHIGRFAFWFNRATAHFDYGALSAWTVTCVGDEDPDEPPGEQRWSPSVRGRVEQNLRYRLEQMREDIFDEDCSELIKVDPIAGRGCTVNEFFRLREEACLTMWRR